MTTKNSKPRSKKLTLKKIQSEHKKLNTMSTFVYDEDTNTRIKYYEQFSESKIDELLKELHSSLVYVEENNLEFFKDEAEFILFTHFLIIKHFTDLGDEIPDDFPTQFTIMHQLYDKGIYHKLMNDMFDGNEIMKVLDRIDEMVNMVLKIDEAAREELAKLGQLQNKDIFDQSFNQPFNVLASPDQEVKS